MMGRATAQLLGLLLCAYSGLCVSLCIYMVAVLPLYHALAYCAAVLCSIVVAFAGVMLAVAIGDRRQVRP